MANKNGIGDTFFAALFAQYLLLFSWLLGLGLGFTVGYGLYKVLEIFSGANMISSILWQMVYAGGDIFVGAALYIILHQRMPVIGIKEFISHPATRSEKKHYLIVLCVYGACVGLVINGVSHIVALLLNLLWS
jgi:hypothetical protein